MQDPSWLVFGAFLMILCLALLWAVLHGQKTTKETNQETRLFLMNFLTGSLESERAENQLLRNQLRSQSPQELASLNYITNPQSDLSSPPVGDNDDLGEVINYEDLLARKGYTTGDLGYDLESAGWPRAVINNDGEPVSFDFT